MKKFYVTLATMLFMSFAFVACGGEDDPVDDGDNTETGTGSGSDSGNTGGGSSAQMSSSEEKEYLEKVGNEFIGLFNASDYEDIANLGQELDETEGDGIFEDFIEETQTSIYGDKTLLLKLANVKGSFESSYKTREWKKTSSTGDMKMTYTASDGKKWVLTVAHSGNLGTVTIVEDEDYDYSPNGNWNYYTETYKMEVPKEVKATLTKAGNTVAEVSLNITNLIIEKGEPALDSKMSYTMTSKIKDITATSESTYNPGGSASVKATVKKGTKVLADVKVDGKSSMSKGEITNGSGTVNAVILNKLNIKGDITDVKNFVEALDEADHNDENKATFDRWVNNANSYLNLGLYNNNSTKQATIIIGSDSEKDYWGSQYHTYYYAVPMIKFADGSTYSFEEYFTETRFRSLVDAFEKLLKEFENLVD